MVPVFSRAAWLCAWGMVQNDLIHGWGLDYRLGYCAQGDRALNVGVVDSEYVLHRGVPMLLSDGGTARGVEVAIIQGDAGIQQETGGGCCGGRFLFPGLILIRTAAEPRTAK